MQRWQCLIHNGTKYKYELDINVDNFETDYIQLCVLYKSDFRIFTVGKHVEIFNGTVINRAMLFLRVT